MRKWSFSLAVAAIVVSATQAMACGGYGCPVDHTGYGTYGYLGVAPYQTLPVRTGLYGPPLRPESGRYFHVQQGPTFSGPGNFAPYPTYQEIAVRGWSGWERGWDYPYDGGPYGNSLNHYSDVTPDYQGPVIQSYRWHRGRSLRPRVRSYGLYQGRAVRAAGYRVASPGVVYAPGSAVARYQYQRPPRRAY
jgi:hypothetical protein